jgi:hypothetical protein
MQVLPLVFFALIAAFGGLTDKEVLDAVAGKVPTRSEAFTDSSGKASGRGLAAIVIDRPVSDVWRTLTTFEDRAEYVPRLKKVNVLERQRERVHVRQEADATVTTARYTLWFRLDEGAHAIAWDLDKSAPDNTVRDVEGEYRMTEVAPGRTLLVYRTRIDAGIRVPRAIQSYIQRSSMPDLLRAIKKRVESGGTWKKA